jgi:hypothetical protein
MQKHGYYKHFFLKNLPNNIKLSENQHLVMVRLEMSNIWIFHYPGSLVIQYIFFKQNFLIAYLHTQKYKTKVQKF